MLAALHLVEHGPQQQIGGMGRRACTRVCGEYGADIEPSYGLVDPPGEMIVGQAIPKFLASGIVVSPWGRGEVRARIGSRAGRKKRGHGEPPARDGDLILPSSQLLPSPLSTSQQRKPLPNQRYKAGRTHDGAFSRWLGRKLVPFGAWDATWANEAGRTPRARPAGMDLIHDYALPVPTTIIAEMLGGRQRNRHKFHRWSNAIISAASSTWGLLRALPNA